jgi:hypothetical protein
MGSSEAILKAFVNSSFTKIIFNRNKRFSYYRMVFAESIGMIGYYFSLGAVCPLIK